MDDQKVLGDQYITTETLYRTYIRETNDVVKFRGASDLESESERTELVEFDTVTDEIRRWSSVSEDECQWFVSVENGVLTYVSPDS